MSEASPRLFGAVLAGGRSRRYGSDKALAELGGLTLSERAVRAVRPVARRVGIIANDGSNPVEGVPVRPDLVRGAGPLGGILTALEWAGEEGLEGAIVLATDMPFVPSGLLRELAAAMLDESAAVVPASPGPRGLEPLCAVYGMRCLTPVRSALERGERAVVAFFPEVRVTVLDPDRVSAFGDPEDLFFNVNRPVDHERALELMNRPAGAGPDGPLASDVHRNRTKE